MAEEQVGEAQKYRKNPSKQAGVWYYLVLGRYHYYLSTSLKFKVDIVYGAGRPPAGRRPRNAAAWSFCRKNMYDYCVPSSNSVTHVVYAAYVFFWVYCVFLLR